MWIWPGLVLLGCSPVEKRGIRNGCPYIVENVCEEFLTLRDGPKLTHEQAVAFLRLPYALTYASCQGRETEGTLCLHDCSSVNFTSRHLYVGLSRAKLACEVRVQD